nr:unnamed protein product [Callosobruchus analis]
MEWHLLSVLSSEVVSSYLQQEFIQLLSLSACLYSCGVLQGYSQLWEHCAMLNWEHP